MHTQHVNLSAMLAIVRQLFDEIEEPRSRKRPAHSLTDCLVSCLAMFHFRDGSMLQFEKASKMDSRQRNLRLMYDLNGDAPSDTTMRRRLDKVDPDDTQIVMVADPTDEECEFYWCDTWWWTIGRRCTPSSPMYARSD